MATGVIAPAPNPCINRKAIKLCMDQAKPAPIEPNKKTEIPNNNTGFLPNKSESFP